MSRYQTNSLLEEMSTDERVVELLRRAAERLRQATPFKALADDCELAAFAVVAGIDATGCPGCAGHIAGIVDVLCPTCRKALLGGLIGEGTVVMAVDGGNVENTVDLTGARLAEILSLIPPSMDPPCAVTPINNLTLCPIDEVPKRRPSRGPAWYAEVRRQREKGQS